MRNILSVIVFCFSITTLASGVSIKGGGTGVELGSHIGLLDLVEAGLDQASYFGSAPCEAQTFRSLETLLPVSSESHALVCRKLHDVASLDPVLATAFLKTVANLSWVFTDKDLIETDADPIIHVQTVQIAVRNGNRVLIKRDLFNRMPAPHQAALVIHEIAAALVSTKISSPLPVRILIGNLFSKSYYTRSTEQILNDLRYFPSRRNIRNRPQGWSHLALPTDSIETKFTLADTTGSLFYPSITTLWIDTATGERTVEASYVSPETAQFTASTFAYCDQPAVTSKRLLNLTVMYVNPTIFARVKLEDGNQTDRYDFDNQLDLKASVSFNTNNAECSLENLSTLRDLKTWLDSYSAQPLR